MPKVTLDRAAFKALASDTRLDILRTLDGKKLSLKDISTETNLNKATLHEHLTKLTEAGLVKRHEREGHKWVYYKLSWKGESLLHPENTKIVVMFSVTFITLWAGILLLVDFVRQTVSNAQWEASSFIRDTLQKSDITNATNESVLEDTIDGGTTVPGYMPTGTEALGTADPILLYLAIGCFVVCTIVLALSLWRFWSNRSPQL